MPDSLKERERRFVEAYMASGNATDAAVGAGYAKTSAHVTGSRLLRKAKVQAAIDTRVAEDPGIATRERRQQYWTQVFEGQGEYRGASLRDRLRASELLGKSQGDFVERVRHDGAIQTVSQVHFYLPRNGRESEGPRSHPAQRPRLEFPGPSESGS